MNDSSLLLFSYELNFNLFTLSKYALKGNCQIKCWAIDLVREPGSMWVGFELIDMLY